MGEYSGKRLNVLVLCTGNSARSIMSEALFNHLAGDYIQAYSAGSHPTGRVNPFALRQLANLPSPMTPRSKSWDEFALPDAPSLDIVITVCGNAAQEICPHFSGSPLRVHWDLPDPASVEGAQEDIERAFAACFAVFQQRIAWLVGQLKSSVAPVTAQECANFMQQVLTVVE